MYQFFTYVHIDIFAHIFYITFFHNCSLPGVVSGVVAVLHIISVIAAFCVVIGKDDDPNKVEFDIDTYSL